MRARGRGRVFVVTLAAVLALGSKGLFPGSGVQLASPVRAQETQAVAEEINPKGHFQVDRPAELSNAAALTVYLRILDEIVFGYRMSEVEGAGTYRTWRRYNKTPYRSATHGERFVNNYANTKAKAYGNYEGAGDMPVGSVLAKDSFAVTNRGDVFLGPLFMMEKMPAGFSPESRDWRYTMIMPDGSMFGMTKGEGHSRVSFCVTCHKSAGNDNDHLFFVPEGYRVRTYSVQPEDQ
jgi:hypothetical protein